MDTAPLQSGSTRAWRCSQAAEKPNGSKAQPAQYLSSPIRILSDVLPARYVQKLHGFHHQGVQRKVKQLSPIKSGEGAPSLVKFIWHNILVGGEKPLQVS